jgi:hypothetical protein
MHGPTHGPSCRLLKILDRKPVECGGRTAALQGARQGGGSWRKIWLAIPEGCSREIDINEYASVREIFERRRQIRITPAFSCMGKTTFAELETLSAIW